MTTERFPSPEGGMPVPEETVILRMEHGPEDLEKRRRFIKESIRAATRMGVMSLALAGAWEYADQRRVEQAQAAILESAAEADQRKLDDNIRYVVDNYSAEAFPMIAAARGYGKEPEEGEPGLKLVGFAENGLGVERVRRMWTEDYYPKGSLRGNVDEVELKHDLGQAPSGYGMGGALMAGMTKEFEDKIFLRYDNYDSEKELYGALDMVFAHEVGHKNDWVNDERLTPEERVNFLVEVSRAFDRPGRFKDLTGYVDSIRNPDTHKEKWIKVKEWWAELVEAYLKYPDVLIMTSEDDYKLVDKWLKRHDPDFDPFGAAVARETIAETGERPGKVTTILNRRADGKVDGIVVAISGNPK